MGPNRWTFLAGASAATATALAGCSRLTGSGTVEEWEETFGETDHRAAFYSALPTSDGGYLLNHPHPP